MSNRTKAILAIGGGIAVLAVVVFLVFLVLGGGAEDVPGINRFVQPKTCPLTGEEPKDEEILDRPAVAVKIENASIAYPLSGLERADIVYEEAVEGGITRFMAIYHCTDAAKAGPVRSARAVDPAIMIPTTKILAFSGANEPVMQALRDSDVVIVDETSAESAMRRIDRPGISLEHTLYANTAGTRKVGQKEFDDAPSGESLEFGDLEGKTKRATTVQIDFSAATSITYEFQGGAYLRSQAGEPFVDESGKQIAVDNVLIEEHEVNFSEIKDAAGNPSLEIADETGSGRAVLFRDGKAVVGTWSREELEGPVTFESKSGDTMLLSPGSTWIHLVPSPKGEVKGSFSYE